MLKLTDAEFRSLVMIELWAVSNRTDGLLERDDVDLVPRTDPACLDALVRHGLLEPHDRGWRVVGWEDEQTSSDQIARAQRARKVAAEKKARQRARRRAEEAGEDHEEDALEEDHVDMSSGTVPGGSPRDVSRGPHRIGQDRTGKDLGEGTRASASLDADVLFEQAWSAWPKKTGKKTARQKFAIALRGFRGHEDDLVAAITRHAEEHRHHTEARFIPGLTPWLNGERWEDPLPGTPEAGGPSLPAAGPARDPNAWMQPGARVERHQDPHPREAVA
ncbi:hypothetical protein [Frigoribacterium salinisoli]